MTMEPFLKKIIESKIKAMSDKEFFFCNGIIKNRSLVPSIYCKRFDALIYPSICRSYRATLELQNILNSFVNIANTYPDKKQVLQKRLLLNLNESGKLLVNSFFMKRVFGKLTEMLGHQLASEGSPSVNKFIRTDLFYVDDRLVYNFLKTFLNENLAKLFYFRFFIMFIECDSTQSLKAEQFETWMEQNFWAFEDYNNLDDKVIKSYFHNTSWINNFLENFENFENNE